MNTFIEPFIKKLGSKDIQIIKETDWNKFIYKSEFSKIVKNYEIYKANSNQILEYPLNSNIESKYIYIKNYLNVKNKNIMNKL